MKRLCFILIAILSLTSCDIGTMSDMGRPRCLAMGGSGSLTGPGKEEEADPGAPGLYMSVIEVTDGYDWKRDTACGKASCEAKLFRDGKLLLSFPTGHAHHVGTDPDTFHLLGGHLYSEFSDGSGTYLLKDGQELFLYDGQEFLRGLLIRGDDVYTLGVARGGKDFSYRKNGALLLSVANGDVIGGFDGFLSERNGALYEDGDSICFQFQSSAGERILVTDGVAEPVSAPSSASRFAFRSSGGDVVYMAISGSSSYSVSRPGKMRMGSFPAPVEDLAAGNSGDEVLFRLTRDGCSVVMSEDGKELISVPGSPAAFYVDGDDILALTKSVDGSMYVWDRNDVTWSVPPQYFFSNDCACFSGGAMYMAGTPLGEGKEIIIYKDGKRYEKYGLDGYATGIELVVSPPS